MLKYLYRVTHRSGRVVEQTLEDVARAGDGRSAWADVDPADVQRFELLDRNGSLVAAVEPPKGMEIYHCRRNCVCASDAGSIRTTTYLVGFKSPEASPLYVEIF